VGIDGGSLWYVDEVTKERTLVLRPTKGEVSGFSVWSRSNVEAQARPERPSVPVSGPRPDAAQQSAWSVIVAGRRLSPTYVETLPFVRHGYEVTAARALTVAHTQTQLMVVASEEVGVTEEGQSTTAPREDPKPPLLQLVEGEEPKSFAVLDERIGVQQRNLESADAVSLATGLGDVPGPAVEWATESGAGGSGFGVDLSYYAIRSGKLVDIGQFHYGDTSFVICADVSEACPGKEFIHGTAHWARGESHFAAHRYFVAVYGWSGEKYALYASDLLPSKMASIVGGPLAGFRAESMLGPPTGEALQDRAALEQFVRNLCATRKIGYKDAEEAFRSLE
jgi:hypothetical protein